VAAHDLPAGTVLAGYRVERVLGRGGMGVVYEATQLSLDRTVALKIVTPGLSSDAAFRARFRREGLMQARLEHPNIVTVHEAGESEEVLFLAMRLVRGCSLKDLILEGTLDPPRSLRILHPIAQALDSAHAAGLIHRDIKPQNILVGAGDHPYLADFGVTKGAEETALTRTGQFLGSLGYISPEQIRGEASTSASDIYALGAVLFECLTGVVPYAKDSEAAMLFAHVAEEPPLLTARCPSLPAALDEVLTRAIAKEPSERQASAVQLIEEAEHALNGTPKPTGARALSPCSPEKAPPLPPTDRAPSSAAPAQATTQPIRRGRRLSTIVLCAATVALAAGGFAIGRSGAGKPHTAIASGVVGGGTVELSVPLTWSRPAAAPSLPGLAFTEEIAREDRSSGGVLLAGVLPSAGGVHLLSAAFLARLKSPPSGRDPVRLGAATAYRYRDLRVAGMSGPLTLLVAPSSAGVVGIACLSPQVNPSAFMASCEAVAGTLRLHRARALTLGPDPTYARELSSAVSDLREGDRISNSLASAHTQAEQALLCHRLARIALTVADTLAAAKPGPDAANLNTDLIAALRGAGRGYEASGDAATAGNSSVYSRAAREVSRELTSARRALTALQAIGYRV
jgi:Protein kinase domain